MAIVKLLLEAGVSLDGASLEAGVWLPTFRQRFSRDNISTALLHGAVFAKRTALVRVLINAGVAVDSVSDEQMTPLHIAILHAHIPITKVLLDAGADINACGQKGATPLFCFIDALHDCFTIEQWQTRFCLLRILLTRGA